MPRKLIIKSPIDGATVGTVPRRSPRDVRAAYARLSAAQRDWEDVPRSERLRTVGLLASTLRKHRRELADLLVREIGKTPSEAEAEVLRTADLVDGTVREARRLRPETIRDRRHRGRVQTVDREPLGVVLAISPFNYPINLSISKLAPALAMGNTVLWKPSTQGSVVAARFVRRLYAAGFPRRLLTLITGRGGELGEALVDDPACAMVAMTGGTETGQWIARRAGLVPLLLELGGNDPAIVLADADLDLAAKHIVGGAFKLAGQRCTAVKRVYVVRGAADRLVRKIDAEVGRQFGSVGDPREHPIGPVIDDAAAKRQRRLIAAAKRQGARVIRGGTVRGRYVEPTVLDRVPHRSPVVGEEQFGPVLPIVRVKDVDEAVRLANDTEYGLQASIFTRNAPRAKRLASRIEAGGVHLNGPDQRAPDDFLFTGHKASGLGAQGIRFALERMSQPKAIVTNP
ncbi:MAG: aldehyde dehydrogenase family protein [Patescibacteria group bacterium]|nr:aldehyde dehydrogenase family protein [Patescibacteria group bacterium]